ncbi:helix-turn-helix domain-containing protein [Methylobacterium sp. NEAU 140]|uniref:helix-turn-helix domain-containing protein n=1 Tax=Methylobacterium sp. NEAU 140 TaxID=3064945 RepID=UPI002735FEC1|nr:helix-turn-helix domain-containing protein [Methylobacterium sp. NEAU 140]MDP4021534.1 helix-turn-helix domain-containing protein [Methylobacterium sp. NEAU 140]
MPEQHRFSLWRDVCEDRLIPMSQNYVGDGRFHATIDGTRVGDLGFTKFSLGDLRASTTRQTIRQQINGPDRLFMSLVLSGSVCASQNDRSIRDSVGDFSIRDPSTPWTIEHRGASEVLAIEIPRDRLESLLGSARHFVGLTVGGNLPTTVLARSFLHDLVRLREQLAPEAAERMASVAIDLVAASLAERMAMDRPKSLAPFAPGATDGCDDPDTAAIREALLIRAHRLIEQSLHRPDLTPARLAASLGISVRTLHFVFEPGGVSFSRYVLARRLARADRLLREAAHLSVTEVAYASGFHSLSTFFRCYRAAYGAPPGERRAEVGRARYGSGHPA